MGRLENVVDRYNEYIENMLPGFGEYNPTDKEQTRNAIINYMFARTHSMFKWNGLPDTIHEYMLERYLQRLGFACFATHNDNLYVYFGGLGGEPDEYYRPTIITINNPAQKYNTQLRIDKECVLMFNDTMHFGLTPLHKRYAGNMAEIELSMYLANINSRMIALISAQHDDTKKGAEKYINDIIDGKPGIIAEKAFMEDLKVSPFVSSGAHGIITDLIELMQYNKASWWNEIGLNANYNMKRESINSGESQLNNDALSPLIDDMLKQRQEGAEKVNAMFGTDITVEFNSAWKDNEIEIEKELDAIADNGNDNENDGEGENDNEASEV